MLALVRCPAARVIWESVHFVRDLEEWDHIPDFLSWWQVVLNKFTLEECCEVAMICYGLWTARNELLFKDNPRCHGDIIGAAISCYTAFKEARSAIGEEGERARESWSPPCRGVVKANCDAGFLGDGVVGFGVVFRDEGGDVLGAAVKQEKGHWTPDVAEAKAVLFAMKVALGMGFEHLEVESDCLRVVRHLQKSCFSNSSFSLVIRDILDIGSLFSSVIWSHVRRSGNNVAHILAKLCPIELGERIWFDCGPECIADAVAFDICENFIINQ